LVIPPIGMAITMAITRMATAIVRMDTTDRIDTMVIPRGLRTTGTGIVVTTIGIITTIAIKLA